MVRLAHVVTILLATAALAQAQAPVILAIDDAVALALRENPTVRAKQHEYRATQAQEITAGLRPNPTASYSGDQLGSSSVDSQHFWALEQPIELGGKRGRRLDAARAAIRVTAAELDDVRRQTVAQVKKAFTDTLVAAGGPGRAPAHTPPPPRGAPPPATPPHSEEPPHPGLP